MTTHITDNWIAEQEAICAKASQPPWYGGYSSVYCKMSQDESDRLEALVGERPTPISLDNPEYVAWCQRRREAYEADPLVLSVPAEYGDTATGRHAADMEFAISARTALPLALAELRRVREIVGKLPITADGVPIPPGTTVYELRGTYVHKTFVTGYDQDLKGIWTVFYRDGFPTVWNWDRVYSTEQAALAARERGE